MPQRTDYGASPSLTNFTFKSNIVGGEYSLSSPAGAAAAGLSYAPGADVTGNVFAGWDAMNRPMPPGNYMVRTSQEIRLGSDGSLPPDSPYRNGRRTGATPARTSPA